MRREAPRTAPVEVKLPGEELAISAPGHVQFQLGIAVTEASMQDCDEARDRLGGLLAGGFGWSRGTWADGGYAGKLAE